MPAVEKGCVLRALPAVMLALQMLFALLQPALAWRIGNAGLVGWNTFNLGAGGLVRHMAIGSDGSKFVGVDTYGAYYCAAPCAPGAKFTQVVTSLSIPGVTAPFQSPVASTSPGVFDVAIAPGNAILYMVFNGDVYRSSTFGASWVNLGLAQDTSADPNGSAGYRNHKLAVDPNNANAVTVCTPTAGCSYTANASLGGSTVWVTISSSSIAAANTTYGYVVAYGPSSDVYVVSYGQGVYHATTVSGSWTKLSASGMPTSFTQLITDSSDNAWLVDDSYAGGGDDTGALNEYAISGNTWTQCLANTNFIGGVAINPSHPTRIYAGVQGGATGLFVSTSGCTGFGSETSINNSVATDIPWLAVQTIRGGNQMDMSMLVFDPNQDNTAYLPAGLGVWYTNPPTASGAASVIWTSQSAAIEQLETNWIVSPNTPGSSPWFAEWDDGIFTNAAPQTSYPSTNLAGGTIANHSAWGVDWCSSSPSTIVALVTNIGPVDNSGIYSSGTYTPFATGVVASGIGSRGGYIACSTPNVICAVGTDSVGGGTPNNIICTGNGGSSWTAASYTGTAPNTGNGQCTGWGANFFDQSQLLIADRGNGDFYAYNAGAGSGSCVLGAAGIWRWTGSGNWTLVVSGQFDSGFNTNAQMRAVPGQSGDFFYTSGTRGNAVTPANYPLRECVDTGTVACSNIANTKEIWSVGFGKLKPGQTYPAVFVIGWISQDSGSTYSFGEWRSDDHCVTWNYLGAFANNSLDTPTVIEGDNNVYGRAYVGFHGSGGVQYN